MGFVRMLKSPMAITAAGPGARGHDRSSWGRQKKKKEAPVSAHHFVESCGPTAFCQKMAAERASEMPAWTGREGGGVVRRVARPLGDARLGSHKRKVIPWLSPVSPPVLEGSGTR